MIVPMTDEARARFKALSVELTGELRAAAGISWQHGISRATANRRCEYGLAVIVWRLNGKAVPRKRSMAFVIQRTG